MRLSLPLEYFSMSVTLVLSVAVAVFTVACGPTGITFLVNNFLA